MAACPRAGTWPRRWPAVRTRSCWARRSPPRRPGPDHHKGHAPGDPPRARPRERRPDEPVRGAEHGHGHMRLPDGQGVPEGRGHGGTGTADRGQGPAAFAGCRHGPLNPYTTDAGERGEGPVLVVDFGAQYAQLIARRVREAHVYSEIVPHSATASELMARHPSRIILSGGPQSVNETPAPTIDPAIYDTGVPILGICYGAQLLARQLGGEVSRTG